MKIALVLTVKNEARLLRSNILYHRALGVHHVFVYFDNTTDTGPKSIEDLMYVTTANSVDPAPFMNMEFLDKFTSKAQEHHTARQCLNTYHALQQAEEMGCDWLLSIDADELIAVDASLPAALPDFFNNLPSATEVVRFVTKEVVARKIAYEHIFAEEPLFKTQPFYGNRFKNIYKSLYNPFTGKRETFSYWFGQHLGKAAIKTHAGIVPKNVHRYSKENGKKPAVLNRGMVLHYHAYDAADFIKKFTNFSNRPKTFLSGNSVNRLKLLLRDIVNSSGMTQKELVDYFEANLMFRPKEVEALERNRYLGILRRKPAPFVEITSVQKVFKTLGTE